MDPVGIYLPAEQAVGTVVRDVLSDFATKIKEKLKDNCIIEIKYEKTDQVYSLRVTSESDSEITLEKDRIREIFKEANPKWRIQFERSVSHAPMLFRI
jgi:hypothetical protein